MPDETKKVDLTVLVEDREPRADPLPYALGDWYWVPVDEDDTPERLSCIIRIGSNYVMFEAPIDGRSYWTGRVHFDEMDTCRREPDAQKIIAEKINEQRQIISESMKQIQAITSRLALGESAPAAEACALAVHRGSSMDEYKQALITAKDKSLPDLFNTIKEASSVMTTWLSADMIPLKGSTERLESTISVIKSRIFGVELYAGLIEQVEEIKSGAPAPRDEPIHLFQRRHYMDEECLAAYEAGGISFEHLSDFEAWLLKPANLSRILPYPRAIVAFRVRREKKEDEDDFEEFVRILFDGRDQKDMFTYLYLKNGEQVYRLRTGIDFGEKLFPDIERGVLEAGKVYAIRDWSKIDRLATEGEYLDLLRRETEEKIALEKVPEKDRWKWNSSIRVSSDKWILWDRATVYYDDIKAFVKDQIDEHNRLVLVLQGLFDRSQVFQPHPPYKLWSPEDFSKAFTLVYDESRALSAGDKPDFKAYQEKVNRGLRSGVLTVGQDDFWARREAEKYNEDLIERYGHDKCMYMRKKKYRPQGDPGPGIVATVAHCTKTGNCSFGWQRRRKNRFDRWGNEDIREISGKIVVPAEHLLCLATYKPGDFHIFYDDPRTRAEYLKWAPLLLRAEEWHQQRNNPKEI